MVSIGARAAVLDAGVRRKGSELLWIPIAADRGDHVAVEAREAVEQTPTTARSLKTVPRVA